MLLLLLLFKARDNIKLRCFKIITEKLYHVMSYKPDVCCKTLNNPQPTQLLHQVHMMSHITCHLRFLCWVHVIFGQRSSLPSSLFSPISSCLVQVACDVIQPAVLFALWSVHSIIQLPFTTLMVASCQTRKEIQFK